MGGRAPSGDCGCAVHRGLIDLLRASLWQEARGGTGVCEVSIAVLAGTAGIAGRRFRRRFGRLAAEADNDGPIRGPATGGATAASLVHKDGLGWRTLG